VGLGGPWIIRRFPRPPIASFSLVHLHPSQLLYLCLPSSPFFLLSSSSPLLFSSSFRHDARTEATEHPPRCPSCLFPSSTPVRPRRRAANSYPRPPFSFQASGAAKAHSSATAAFSAAQAVSKVRHQESFSGVGPGGWGWCWPRDTFSCCSRKVSSKAGREGQAQVALF